MSAMWDIWRFFIPSRRWSHWSYYICNYCRAEKHNKLVSLIKLHGYVDISLSHLWHWSYLLMLFQQGRLCEAWREYFPRNIKGIEKGLEIYGFGIVKYSVRSESGRMIAIRAQSHYVPGILTDLHIILPRGINTSGV